MIVNQRIRRRERAWPAARAACCLALLSLVRAPIARCDSDPGPLGGTLAATSDYIYRGVSQSEGQGALQGDLHLSLASGTFAGVWASSRDRSLQPDASAEVQVYLGQRFAGGSSWSANVSGRADLFVGGEANHLNDYEEISAALTWLDRCTLSLTAIPNAVRYSFAQYEYQGYPIGYYQRYRSGAWDADGSVQWLLREGVLGGGLYVTAAAGYYYASRPDNAPVAAVGYLYGNAGLALERGRWRIDLGYFDAQSRAAQLFPYPVAKRLAATLSWQF